MTQVQTAPYGTWKSPITSDLIVKESIGLAQVKVDGDDTYWIEMRPSEGGRQVIGFFILPMTSTFRVMILWTRI